VVAFADEKSSAGKHQENERQCEQEPPGKAKARPNLFTNRSFVSYIHVVEL
jgi:hypothetical protein